MANEEQKQPKYHIKIDRTRYTVHQASLTGAELRQIPVLPVGDDRDLFEVVPGSPDKKISDTDTVTISDGLRFFTAPRHINPGMSTTGVETNSEAAR